MTFCHKFIFPTVLLCQFINIIIELREHNSRSMVLRIDMLHYLPLTSR
jgi:hypothetical protein